MQLYHIHMTIFQIKSKVEGSHFSKIKIQSWLKQTWLFFFTWSYLNYYLMHERHPDVILTRSFFFFFFCSSARSDQRRRDLRGRGTPAGVPDHTLPGNRWGRAPPKKRESPYRPCQGCHVWCGKAAVLLLFKKKTSNVPTDLVFFFFFFGSKLFLGWGLGSA